MRRLTCCGSFLNIYSFKLERDLINTFLNLLNLKFRRLLAHCALYQQMWTRLSKDINMRLSDILCLVKLSKERSKFRPD